MGYQGREFRTHIQAPTEAELDRMIERSQGYSRGVGTGIVSVLQKGKDPDGGWEATVVAHNRNPIDWIKEKFGGSEEEKYDDEEEEYEEAERKAKEAELKEEKEAKAAELKAKRKAREEEKAYIEGMEEQRRAYLSEEEKEELERRERGEQKEKEAWKEMEKAAELERSLGRSKLEESIAESEEGKKKKEWEAGRRQWERYKDVEAEERMAEKHGWAKSKAGSEKRERVRKEVGTYAGGIYKAVAAPGGKKELLRHREMYVPKAGVDAYVPTGMRELTTVPKEARGISASEIGEPLRKVSAPKLGKLQAAGTPGAGLGTPIAGAAMPSTSLTHPNLDLGHLRPRSGGVSFGELREASMSGTGLVRPSLDLGHLKTPGQNISLGMLKEASMPKGLTMIEKAAYAEILGNGDRDTVKHITHELSALGIARQDTKTAIGSLVQKGLIKATYEAAGEEPVMEVAR